MSRLGWLLLITVIASAPAPLLSQQTAPAQAPDAPTPDAGVPAAQGALTRPVGTLADLMVQVIYPTSDAVFYVETRTPDTEAGWVELQAKFLTLAESANLLMLPGRAKDQDRWMKDAKMMLDAGTAAYRGARQRDVAAIVAASEPLLTACITCHQDYRPTYRRRLP